MEVIPLEEGYSKNRVSVANNSSTPFSYLMIASDALLNCPAQGSSR